MYLMLLAKLREASPLLEAHPSCVGCSNSGVGGDKWLSGANGSSISKGEVVLFGNVFFKALCLVNFLVDIRAELSLF